MEMKYVLQLWLVEPPIYAAAFCRLILGTFLLDRLSTGYMLAVNAHGRIAGYQASIGTILVLTLPLAWLFLYMGFAPTSVGLAFIITMIFISVGRALWAKRLLGSPVRRWVKTVVIPCCIVGSLATVVASFPWYFFDPSFLRLLLVTGSSVVGYAIATWLFAFDHKERTFFVQNSQKVWRKISCSKNHT